MTTSLDETSANFDRWVELAAHTKIRAFEIEAQIPAAERERLSQPLDSAIQQTAVGTSADAPRGLTRLLKKLRPSQNQAVPALPVQTTATTAIDAIDVRDETRKLYGQLRSQETAYTESVNTMRQLLDTPQEDLDSTWTPKWATNIFGRPPRLAIDHQNHELWVEAVVSTAIAMRVLETEDFESPVAKQLLTYQLEAQNKYARVLLRSSNPKLETRDASSLLQRHSALRADLIEANAQPAGLERAFKKAAIDQQMKLLRDASKNLVTAIANNSHAHPAFTQLGPPPRNDRRVFEAWQNAAVVALEEYIYPDKTDDVHEEIARSVETGILEFKAQLGLHPKREGPTLDF